ncbi:MAG: DUF4175 family protein [Planctomycetes bacterium]|nr:DUF4175 family protein [Planctomycetota bacterium]
MDPQIEYFLARVAQRFRSRRWAWCLSLLWLALALAIGAGWISIPALEGLSWRSWATPLGIVFAGFVVSWLYSRWSHRDLRAMASHVERAFPTLEQRLLTSANTSTDSSPYFRRRLAQDVIRHARSHDWKQALSPFQFWGAWMLQWLAFLCLAMLVSMGWNPSLGKLLPSGAADAIFGPSDRWQVEPGDIEVERGSDLFVTLRFEQQRSERIDLDAKLILEKPDAREMLAMARSLGDSIFGAAVRRVEDSFQYRVEVSGQSSPTYRATVFEYPALVRCDALIEPPSYARQPEKRIEDTRRVTVPEETKLTWICTLNKPIDIAELVDEDDIATPLVAESENSSIYRATFTMKKSKKWKIRLIDRDGRRAKIEEQLSARVLQNKPSAIQLGRPADQRVSPIQEIDLTATLTDDFGIRKGGLTYSLSGQEPREIVLLDAPELSSMALKEEVSYSLALEDLNAQSDQLLSYYFWMEDLDNNGNPRRTDGDMFFAEVRPFEELFRQGDNASSNQQQSQQSQGSQASGMAEELGELQKKIITGTWNTIREFNVKSNEERRTSVDVLLESQQQARSQTDALSQAIQSEDSQGILQQIQQSMDDAIEKLNQAKQDSSSDSLRQAMQQERTAYEGLLKLRAREFEVNQSQQSQSSSQSQSQSQRSRQQQIEQLKLENDENRYETESRPETNEDAAQREMRQVMNRLDELARRQQDLNEQLRELDLALQEAKTEEAKKEIEEQLKRLRDSQQELLQDTDELLDRMNRESNQQSMQESREQMEQAREQLRESSEAIEQQQPSSALASGSRAQQTMEQTRESLRQQSASGLQENMRELLEQADSLERRQQQLEQRMPGRPADDATPRPEDDTNPPNQNSVLRPEASTEADDSLAKDWQQQRQALEELLENVKETVTESETSEPVLAEELYETYRQAQREQLGERLEKTSQLLERGLDEPARTLADQAGQGIRRLREQIEQSSESVLGSEQQSLNRALRELDRAREALQPENESADPQGSNPRGSDSEEAESERPSGQQQEGQQQEGQQREGQQRDGQQRDGQQRDGQQRDGQQRDGQQREGQQRDGQQRDGQQRDGQQREGQQRDGQQRDGQQRDGQQREGQQWGNQQRAETGRSLGPWNMELPMGPLLGEEYQEWNDSIREVEELVRDPELKAEAARIREAAREMRIEYKRHSKVPQWPLVERLITQPMDQLRGRIAQELLRKTAEKNQIVPLDRDPVPRQFQKALDSYFERLGSESPKP